MKSFDGINKGTELQQKYFRTRSRTILTCITCNKEYEEIASREARGSKYCSKKCRKQSDLFKNMPDEAKKARAKKISEKVKAGNGWKTREHNKQVKLMTTALKVFNTHAPRGLSPRETSEIRGMIAEFVTEQIVVANEVVMHDKEWTPTQARVFGMLLNKVIPDLNSNHTKLEVETKDITHLSRAELEEIAAGAKLIEHEPRTNEEANEEK